MRESHDPTQLFHHGEQFSSEAHKSIKHDKARVRELVFNCIKEAQNGRTCDEIETELELSHQSASARMTELKANNRIKLVFKRATRSGRLAGVYVVRGV